MSQVVQFPAHRVIERDVHGGLHKAVMDLVQEAAVYLDDRAERKEARQMGARGAAIAVERMRLTYRLLEMAGVMALASLWVKGSIPAAECRQRVMRCTVRTKVRPTDEARPEKLRELHEAADELAVRVAGVQARLIAAANSNVEVAQ